MLVLNNYKETVCESLVNKSISSSIHQSHKFKIQTIRMTNFLESFVIFSEKESFSYFSKYIS